jgi:hypothetical protein
MCKLHHNTKAAFCWLLAKDSLDDALIPLHCMSRLRYKYSCANPGNGVIPELLS